MSVVCRLTVVAALFFIGVDSVAARHHEGDNRGDNNFGDMRPPKGGGHMPTLLGSPPPNPEALEVIEELLEEGIFSDEAHILRDRF